MTRLADRAILVTGGASGIGEATAERAVAEGARVAIVDRDGARLEQVTRRLGGCGATVVGYVADVGVSDEVARAVARAGEALGPLAGLVTSAGIFDPGDMQPAGEVAPATFERVLRVNLLGTFLTVHHALPQLLESGGAVVTIASTAGLRGHGFGSGYTASKGGVIAFTRLLAFQYGSAGVRANCVCPGLTATPMNAAALDDPDFVARVSRGIPQRRVGGAAEIASVVCHLLSADASYVSGQVIAVDGGATVV